MAKKLCQSRSMTHRALYKSDDGRVYNQDSFAEEYNNYSTIDDAAEGMKISKKRLSVIACRLRSRGYTLKNHSLQARLLEKELVSA